MNTWINIIPHLKCPISGLRLKILPLEEIDHINKKISSEALRHYDGSVVRSPIDSGLCSSDGQFLFPIYNNIIIALKSLSIVLKDTETFQYQPLRKEQKLIQNFYDQIGWQKKDQNVFEDAQMFEDLRPVVQDYIHQCHMRVNDYIQPKGRFLVDVASGPVQYEEYLSYSEYYDYRICVDISLRALQEAQSKLGPKGIYILGDIANLPFEDNWADAIVSLHTIYHLPADLQPKAIQEIHRVLKPCCSAVIVYSWGFHSVLMNLTCFPFRVYAFLRRRLAQFMNKIKNLRNQSDQHEAFLYAKPLNYKFFSKYPWGFDFKIVVWRSLGVPLTRFYIQSWLAGRSILRMVQNFEQKYPQTSGRFGQYPLFVIRKK
jgi:SAM-dependent methyltransferase